MANFRYKAVNAAGNIIHGRQEAANDLELETQLNRLNLDLISFREYTPRPSLFGPRKVSRQDLINFCFYLEQQHSAGVSILESLADIRDSVDNLKLRTVISGILEKIEGGKTLSEAMADYPQVFNPVFVNLIHAGEQSSRLDEVLAELITALKWQDEMASQTKKVMMYPAFIAVFVLGVAVFLLTYLVPEVVRFLGTTGNAIPWYTRALIQASSMLINYWYVFLLAPATVITVVYFLLKKSPRAKLMADRLLLSLPVIGPILNRIILSRLTNTFALLYSADITILESLKICNHITGNRFISEAVGQIREQIERGGTLTDSFASTGIFPNLVIRMVRVGESTGALDKSLRNVSYFYNREIQDAVNRIQVMIEPVLILFLAVFLIWIAVSVLFPIYDIMGDL